VSLFRTVRTGEDYAADIVRMVALDLTLTNMALLGGLVIVRTFLGWALTVEVEGRWLW